MRLLLSLAVALILTGSAPLLATDEPDTGRWPPWASDVPTLCAGLGLWGWVEPDLPDGGTNTVRLVIRPADPADWPECDVVS